MDTTTITLYQDRYEQLLELEIKVDLMRKMFAEDGYITSSSLRMLFCPRCAAKEANDIYAMMDEPMRRQVFDDAFGAYKDLEVFETFWDDLSVDDHLELMGFKRFEVSI